MDMYKYVYWESYSDSGVVMLRRFELNCKSDEDFLKEIRDVILDFYSEEQYCFDFIKDRHSDEYLLKRAVKTRIMTTKKGGSQW